MTQKKPSKNKQFNGYLKYSGMAFQMIATILIGLFVGKFIDSKAETSIVFTAIGSLVGVVAGLYIALKDFIKK